MDFASSYRLNIKYDDKLTGLLAWFDCYFTHGTKHVLLSTSILNIKVHFINQLIGNKLCFI